MDYKYIKQLLERYWRGETSLEEEEILRAFFAQEDVPAELAPYRDFFGYLGSEKQADTLGDDFDSKMLARIGSETKVKAAKVTIRSRLMPLFKAAAVVAMLLTIGNAVQMAVDDSEAQQPVTSRQQSQVGPSMAKADTVKLDSVRQDIMAQPQQNQVK